MLPLNGDRKPKPFLQSPYSLTYPAFSPDGRWLAYVSSESGNPEVYVQPYPGPGEKIRISVDQGHSPVFAKSGRELFYERGTGPVEMMAVEIDITKGFQAGKPRLLFEGAYAINGPMRGYDIAPDGERFILMTRVPDDAPPPVTHVHIVLNWMEEVKRRLR